MRLGWVTFNIRTYDVQQFIQSLHATLFTHHRSRTSSYFCSASTTVSKYSFTFVICSLIFFCWCGWPSFLCSTPRSRPRPANRNGSSFRLMALCRAVAISSVQRKVSMSVSTHIFDSVQGRLAADAIKRKAAPHGPKRRRFFVRGVAPEESPCRSGESIFHWRTALKTDSTICLIGPVVTRTA